jgi:putative phosphoribosyl transferase
VTFSSRTDAVRRLGIHLAERGTRPDIVLGLPRGGVVVAAEVGRRLGCPLDVLVVRKIGHPRQPEFAVGAMAEPDVLMLDQQEVAEHRVNRAELDDVIAEETERLRGYRMKFHRVGGPELAGKSVLIVDDGLATGATAVVAVMSARKQLARTVLVAVPVASSHAVARLTPLVDRVMALLVDPDFMAVGQYYEDFPQIEDHEVAALLRGAHENNPASEGH